MWLRLVQQNTGSVSDNGFYLVLDRPEEGGHVIDVTLDNASIFDNLEDAFNTIEVSYTSHHIV